MAFNRSRGRRKKTSDRKKKSKKVSYHSYRVPTRDYLGSVQDYLEALDCPRALTVWLMFSNQEHGQLIKLKCSSEDFLSTEHFRDSYAATNLFKKFQGFKIPGVDRKEAALAKFLKYEDYCRDTNTLFKDLSKHPGYTGNVVWLHDAVKRKIAEVLGDLNVTKMLERGNWGPGASTLIKSADACSPNKFQFETGVTRDLFALLSESEFFEYNHTWGSTCTQAGYPNFQVGNILEFVPKDSDIDRPIGKEPGINCWFQLGIGKEIRQCLRKCGINLNSQLRNQVMAKLGSITNELATGDFSSASDLYARRVVEELLPPQWFHLLDTCRSHFGSYDGKLMQWEKFSSMGNGFTFELESLIFYCIAYAVGQYKKDSFSHMRSSISVFGDDVILPSRNFALFSEMCNFYGFLLNSEKSFVYSDFRESCGEHYLRGHSVKPIFLKEKISNVPKLFRFHNAIRRRSHMYDLICDQRYEQCCRNIVGRCPERLSLRIPASLGEGGFISNFDEATPPRHRLGIEGFRVKNLVEKSISYPFEGTGLILSSLWLLEQRGKGPDVGVFSGIISAVGSPGDPSNERKLKARKVGDPPEGEDSFVVRRGRTRYTVVRSSVRTWVDLGPWIKI